MITAVDVDSVLFDVLGTVVDEAGSIRAELAAALDRTGMDPGQGEVLAAAGPRRFADLVASIRRGATPRGGRPTS